MARTFIRGIPGSPNSQEFYFEKNVVDVRVATTVSGTLASSFQNGSSVDGVTLITGDRILIKDQVTNSENGIYIVNSSGAPTRDVSADIASELNGYVAWTDEGTTNKHLFWYQTGVLSSFSDTQTWTSTTPTFNFEVPDDVSELNVKIAGGGGGGGAGGGGFTGTFNAGKGGAGGSGTLPLEFSLKVVPGETITVAPGARGKKGRGAANPNVAAVARPTGVNTTVAASNGENGGNSTISGSFGTIIVPGGLGGSAGLSAVNAAGVPQAGNLTNFNSNYPPVINIGSGAGGAATASTAGSLGSAGSDSIYNIGGQAGTTPGTGSGGSGGGGGTGGGGGSGVANGGDGGNGTNGNGQYTMSHQIPMVSNAPNMNSIGISAGGGGGGGSGSAVSGYLTGPTFRGVSGHGAHGGSGYIKFSW